MCDAQSHPLISNSAMRELFPDRFPNTLTEQACEPPSQETKPASQEENTTESEKTIEDDRIHTDHDYSLPPVEDTTTPEPSLPHVNDGSMEQRLETKPRVDDRRPCWTDEHMLTAFFINHDQRHFRYFHVYTFVEKNFPFYRDETDYKKDMRETIKKHCETEDNRSWYISCTSFQSMRDDLYAFLQEPRAKVGVREFGSLAAQVTDAVYNHSYVRKNLQRKTRKNTSYATPNDNLTTGDEENEDMCPEIATSSDRSSDITYRTENSVEPPQIKVIENRKETPMPTLEKMPPALDTTQEGRNPTTGNANAGASLNTTPTCKKSEMSSTASPKRKITSIQSCVDAKKIKSDDVPQVEPSNSRVSNATQQEIQKQMGQQKRAPTLRDIKKENNQAALDASKLLQSKAYVKSQMARTNMEQPSASRLEPSDDDDEIMIIMEKPGASRNLGFDCATSRVSDEDAVSVFSEICPSQRIVQGIPETKPEAVGFPSVPSYDAVPFWGQSKLVVLALLHLKIASFEAICDFIKREFPYYENKEMCLQRKVNAALEETKFERVKISTAADKTTIGYRIKEDCEKVACNDMYFFVKEDRAPVGAKRIDLLKQMVKNARSLLSSSTYI